MADIIRLRHAVTGVTVTVAPEAVEGLKTYGFTDFQPVEPDAPADPEPQPVKARPERKPRTRK